MSENESTCPIKSPSKEESLDNDESNFDINVSVHQNQTKKSMEEISKHENSPILKKNQSDSSDSDDSYSSSSDEHQDDEEEDEEEQNDVYDPNPPKYKVKKYRKKKRYRDEEYDREEEIRRKSFWELFPLSLIIICTVLDIIGVLFSLLGIEQTIEGEFSIGIPFFFFGCFLLMPAIFYSAQIFAAVKMLVEKKILAPQKDEEKLQEKRVELTKY